MRKCLAIAIVLLFSAAAIAQMVPVQTTEPGKKAVASQSPRQEMGDVMEQMGPMMQNMMEGMYASMFKVLAKPQTASQLAAFTRNYYEELVKKGFTKEEAFKIVVGMGFPAAKGG